MKPLSGALTVSAATAVAVLTVGVGAASAHVHAESADASPGGYGEVTFRVPNESETASTISVAVQLPTDTPLASVSTEPVPGWDVALKRETLPEPITDDDGNQITEAVTQVTWTATAGGFGPGQYQNFSMSVGPFPDTDSITLPTVQTYSDGSESAWIEPTVEGQDEPESPAPVLSLTGAGHGSTTDAHGSSTDTASAATDTQEAAATSDAGGTSGVAVTALVVGILALLAAVGSLVVGLRGRRTTGA